MITGSLILPLFYRIKESILEPKAGDSPMIRDMRKVMLAKYQTRHTWAQKRIFSAMTTLDVRFKLHPCLKNNPVVEDLGERLIKHEMQKIVQEEIAVSFINMKTR